MSTLVRSHMLLIPLSPTVGQDLIECPDSLYEMLLFLFSVLCLYVLKDLCLLPIPFMIIVMYRKYTYLYDLFFLFDILIKHLNGNLRV